MKYQSGKVTKNKGFGADEQPIILRSFPPVFQQFFTPAGNISAKSLFNIPATGFQAAFNLKSYICIEIFQ